MGATPTQRQTHRSNSYHVLKAGNHGLRRAFRRNPRDLLRRRALSGRLEKRVREGTSLAVRRPPLSAANLADVVRSWWLVEHLRLPLPAFRRAFWHRLARQERQRLRLLGRRSAN